MINWPGQRFGRLLVVSRAPNHKQPNGRQRTALNVICDCGKAPIVQGGSLTSGNTKSCGCLRSEMWTETITTHGKSNTATYKVWCGIRKRCFNPADQAFDNYGGRGITLCARWQTFENFLADMGERPFKAAQIDRQDNNGNYEPGNCKWSTASEQARNRRNNIMITINGETKCLLDWVLHYGVVDYATASARIRQLKWEPKRAVTEPPAPCGPRYLSSTKTAPTCPRT